MKARFILPLICLIAITVRLHATDPGYACSATAATGAHCSAECIGMQWPVCYASGTEAHCECRDEAITGRRSWGPVRSNGARDIQILGDFATYLRGTLQTPGALQLANDCDATVVAIQTLSQSTYEAANDSYADHWDNLPASDRQPMLDWISANAGLH